MINVYKDLIKYFGLLFKIILNLKSFSKTKYRIYKCMLIIEFNVCVFHKSFDEINDNENANLLIE